MPFLLDTSILVRLANATDAQHPVAVRAVLELHRRGEVLQITPQVLIEFRSVATRPKSANGAGLSIVDTEAHAGAFETRFPILADTPDIYPAWKTSACHVHGVTDLLTFNVGHFARLAAFRPGIVAVNPASI
jgi:predicted nucleic acid-binding protein